MGFTIEVPRLPMHAPNFDQMIQVLYLNHRQHCSEGDKH